MTEPESEVLVRMLCVEEEDSFEGFAHAVFADSDNQPERVQAAAAMLSAYAALSQANAIASLARSAKEFLEFCGTNAFPANHLDVMVKDCVGDPLTSIASALDENARAIERNAAAQESMLEMLNIVVASLPFIADAGPATEG